jgi:hypothetical protein
MRPGVNLKSRKNGERGFALLIVFLLAAAVALMLYGQMRRVAFESEREKEQLLQDRGKQYVRAIQLYYVAFKKYPSKIEDLESTNDKRFLRRRYIDPMTGKDEWRLIHVNAAGQLTDSLVQKPPAGPNGTDPSNPLSAFGTGAGSTAAGTGTGTGAGATGAGSTGQGTPGTANGTGTADGQPPEVNAAVMRRPSDRPLVPPGGIGSTPGAVDPTDQRYWPPITLQPQTGVNGQTNGNPQAFPVQQYPGQLPGQTQVPGQTSVLQGGFQPGVPGFPFQPGNNQQINNYQQVNNNTSQTFNGPAGLPGSGQAGSTNPGIVPGAIGPGGGVPGGVVPGGGVYGFQVPGTQNGFLPNGQSGAPAAGSGGFGLPNSTNITGTTGVLQSPPSALNGTSTNAIGAAGLAGVASTYKGPSIKIYKDRQKYQEWEFIFDLKSGQQNPQQAQNGQGANGQNGQGANGQGTNGQGANGASFLGLPSNSGSSTNSGSGANSGSGTNSGSGAGTFGSIIPHY